MPKNVSRWVAAAKGSARAEEMRGKSRYFSMFLGFKNKDALKALIEAQYRPGSTQYQKFLTPEQFRARFAPDADKVKLVEDTLKKLGFTLEYTPKSGLFVQAAGTVAQVKSAFGVSQELYSYKGNTLRANRENAATCRPSFSRDRDLYLRAGRHRHAAPVAPRGRASRRSGRDPGRPDRRGQAQHAETIST